MPSDPRDASRTLRDTVIAPPREAPPDRSLAETIVPVLESTPGTRDLANTIADGATSGERLLLVIPGTRLGFADDGRASASDQPRFAVHELLGEGANGAVYRVEDRDLQRDLAVKVLPGAAPPAQVAGFLREARIAASIEHPNVAPVYDLALSGGGQLWYAMKRIDGTSLDEAIDDLRGGRPDAALLALNARVRTILQVGNALQAAHARGVVHRDVKPANIMLGRFGEVMLVDWGCAGSSADLRVGRVGTPLYMSPEQALGQAATAAGDIYALGATLFELLTLRAPLRSRPADDFWALKGAGRIDPPSADERRRVPRQLLAIALKALARDPARRYATCRDLCLDLEHYQSGQAISACRDTWDEALRRLHRRLGWPLWVGLAACVALVALGGAMWREQLRSIATWGAPVLVEDFADDAWATRWRTIEGVFINDGGGVRSTQGRRNILVYGERLDGDTAIEVRARVAAGTPLGDIAIGWSRTPITASTDIAYRCTIGDWDGAVSAIKRYDRYVATYDGLRLAHAQSYRLRVEIVGERLSLSVDGRVICTYLDQFPLTGGYLALFAFDPGKVLERVEVSSLGVPEKLPATAVGDAFVADGNHARAIEEYARVAASHPLGGLGERARFRSGLCHLRLGELAAARADFSALTDPALALLAALELAHRGEPLADDAFLAACERACRAGGEAGERAAQYWSERIDGRRDHAPSAVIRRYLDLHARWLADHPLTRFQAAAALSDLGHLDEVLTRFPDQALVVAFALVRLGRGEEALARYADRPVLTMSVLAAMGRWTEMRQRPGVEEDRSGRWGHREEGRAEEALALGARSPALLMAAGRFDELFATSRDAELLARAAQLAGRGDGGADEAAFPLSTRLILHMGRRELAEAEALAAEVPFLREWPRQLAGLRAARAGRLDEARARFDSADALAFREHHFSFPHFVIAPFIRERLAGEAGALDAACQRALALGRYADHQRTWHRAGYLLGRIDRTAFLAQPHRQFAPAEILLLDAVRAELAGRPDAAAHYRDYLAIPRHLRGSEVDPVLEEFAEWRLAACASNAGIDPGIVPATVPLPGN